MNELLLNKSPIRAAQNKERGRQFNMPDLNKRFSCFVNN